MDEKEALSQETLIGEDARKFVESDLGMALIQLAERDAFSALEKLADVAPGDKEEIASLQREVKLYHTLKSYLYELISRGDEALKVYLQQRDAQ